MSARPGIHHLRPRDAGMMLVELLAARATKAGDYGEANRLVRERRVQVNGNLVADAAALLRAGDVVKVLPHAVSGPARAEDVEIVYADEHLVVVNKPAGVTTMREPVGGERWARNADHSEPKRRNRQATLDDMVALALRRNAGDTTAKSGRKARGRSGKSRQTVLAVHRLDRDTSGLMLFARTTFAERALVGMFKGKQIERSYLAVIHGHPTAVTIVTHLLRDRGDGLRGSAEVWGKNPAAGQRAVTHVHPLERIGPYAVVRCTLETGRTHQIRIHLAERGHMLCGERQYVRRPDGTRQRDDSGAPRHALHAERLALTHPITGVAVKFTSNFPADLSKWLNHLRAKFGDALSVVPSS